MKAIILPVCVLGLLTSAFADDIRPQLAALNDSVSKALVKKDIAAFSAAMKGKVTPDFKYFETTASKAMTFDQMVAEMKGGLAMMTKITSAESRLLKLTASPSTATVLTSHHMTGLIPGKGKQPHTMTFTGVSVDVFKKTGAIWKMASMTWKATERKIDGRIVPAGK
jgi:hypothetical protein